MKRLNASHLVLAAAVGLWSGCYGGAQAAGSWSTHRDPHGFVVSLPSGWHVAYVASKKAAEITGDGAHVAIRPAFARQTVNTAQALAVAQALAADSTPSLHWRRARLVRDGVASIAGDSAARSGMAFLAWRSSSTATAFYLYEADAPANRASREADTFAQIFQSFHIAAPSRSAADARPAAALSFEPIDESQENAFHVELPRGWRNAASLNRVSEFDVRPSYRAIGPDGISIGAGDPSIPPFAMPNAMLQMAGFRIGSTYSPGGGVNMLVEPYMTGLQFAQYYVRQSFGKRCSNVQAVASHDRQSDSRAANATFAQYGLPMQITFGDVAFTCELDGRAMSGYVLAGTQVAQMQGAGIWNVQYLLGYFAPTALESEAAAALDHAAASFTIDPQWAQRNGQQMVDESHAMARNQAQIESIIASNEKNADTVWNAEERYDREAIRGEQNAYDPSTGDTRQISNRYEYDWIDYSGHIVGSDVDASPGLNFRQLVTSP